MITALFGRRARPGAALRKAPPELALRRSTHVGAATRGGFAAARVPA